MKTVSLRFRGRKVNISVRLCGFFSFGLMFRTKNTAPCLFEFNEPTNFKISSLFVFFPFLAVWLDEKNKVIEVKKVMPFTLSINSNKPFNKILEIPINKKYETLLNLLSPVGN